MLDTRRLRRISELHTLPYLALYADLHELLDREYPVNAVEHPLDGRAVLEIPTNDLNPEVSQLPGLRFLRITGKSAYRKTPL